MKAKRVWEEEASSSTTRRTVKNKGRIRHALRLWAWRFSGTAAPRLSRALDFTGAAAATILLSPVIILTWLAIRLEDGGPAVYVQQRVGRNGVLFPLFKFRSMVVNADKLKDKLAEQNESGGGVLFKMRRDPRITVVGRVIRKLSLDELPQLINVLRGEMSLVGPRPALPAEVARYSQGERARLAVRPGITCLWQIGGRSDIDFAGQVRLDMRYIRERSLWNDLLILMRTVPAVLSARGAY